MTVMCLAIADYIINSINNMNNKNNNNEKKLSCKRLQKIIYFCEVNYLKHSNGKSIISDDFYAWESGPVIPDVYYTYMQFQGGFMYPLEDKYLNLNDDDKEVLDKTVKETNNYTTEELIDFSHVKGGPWEKHKEGNGLIPKKEIYDFYKDKKNIYIKNI